MKTIFSILIAGLLLASCELEDVNQETDAKTEVYKTQQPVADYMIGKYQSDSGFNNFYEGSMEITADYVSIDFPINKHFFILQDYTTLMSPDCFFSIIWYNSDHTQKYEVKIYDRIIHHGFIILYLEGVKIAVLRKVDDTKPPVEEPATPVEL